jgi:hypothetical protein
VSDGLGVMKQTLTGDVAALTFGTRMPAAAAAVVIGHRGAGGYRPEHTLASYELAARRGWVRTSSSPVARLVGAVGWA